jgi:hypothetical protein
MLRIGGIINIIIAIGHLVGLIWAEPFFEVTGIGKEMKELALVHPFLPYLLTFAVTLFFLVFGLYGLSADNKFRRLPFMKAAIFTIAGIYLLRGLSQLFTDTLIKGEGMLLGSIYSLAALIIGLLYLLGGIRKWVLKPL